MPRRAAWTAHLVCDGCTYRTRLESGSSRECPACRGFLRMELSRREVTATTATTTTAKADRPAARSRPSHRPGWRARDDRA